MPGGNLNNDFIGHGAFAEIGGRVVTTIFPAKIRKAGRRRK